MRTKNGVSEVVRVTKGELKALIFWSSYGLGKAYGGSYVKPCQGAIKKYGKSVGLSRSELGTTLGRFLPL